MGSQRIQRIHNLEDFIAEARKVHGDKYDYSKAEYVNSNTPICIICPEHEEFWQIPKSHLKGHGCPKCGRIKTIRGKKKTIEDFKAEAEKIHGNRYDYSQAQYVDVNTKITIICHVKDKNGKEHGAFEQSPHSHLRGSGCPKCARINTLKNRRITNSQFIAKARKVHGDYYDYSETKYVKMIEPVTIICPKHGAFKQAPVTHLKGGGCQKCSRERSWENRERLTTESFINQARIIHGDKYDYSDTKYVNSESKVCIICHSKDKNGFEHGCFYQMPRLHLSGCGCEKCARENRGKKRRAKRLSYEEAKAIIATLGIATQGAYKIKYESLLAPLKFPKNPPGAFKNEGWVSWPVFLDNKRKSVDILPYSKAREYASSLGLTSVKEWKELCAKGKIPYGIPYNPQRVYKGKGWVSFEEWLGGTYKSRIRDFYPYEEAKMVIKQFKLSSVEDFSRLIKEGKLPYKIPKNPQHTYKNEWECWQVFLGYDVGFRKTYKYNLLEEFKDEYELKAFLENNDINILQVILRNIEPKYEPIKRDVERALSNANSTNPIDALREKYSRETEEDIDVENQREGELASIDFDDDDVVNEVLAKESDIISNKETKEPTIEEVIKNSEKEIKVINRIEHMLTPEDRQYIMDKFLNDRRRAYMAARDNKNK